MKGKTPKIHTMSLEDLETLFEELGGPEEFDEMGFYCPDHDADESEWKAYREELEAAVEVLGDDSDATCCGHGETCQGHSF